MLYTCTATCLFGLEKIVKNEILNRLSKYIDENSLINVSDIINRDLKSEIVQVVLLAFLHEKSLL